jgi:hypothetical protein
LPLHVFKPKKVVELSLLFASLLLPCLPVWQNGGCVFYSQVHLKKCTVWELTPVILAIQEVEIRRFEAGLGKKN